MQGCGSHSCVIAKPSGMGVNGPCLCDEKALRSAAWKFKQQRDRLVDVSHEMALELAHLAAISKTLPERDGVFDWEGIRSNIAALMRKHTVAVRG